MNKEKKRLLLFVDWFYPGYKAGGPIQSCKNIVDALKNDFEVYIFTSDRDIGETIPYSNVQINQWSFFCSEVKIFYSNASFCTVKNIQDLISDTQPDTIYLNSMFSVSFTLKPLLALKKIKNNIKIVLAPRGMLHSGAIGIKKTKKILFLNLAKITKLMRGIIFHATDEQEVKDIEKFFGRTTKIELIQNIPHINNGQLNICEKKSGEIRFVFISRVHPKKNILYFIDILSGVKSCKITLDIYGYVDDTSYEQKCKNAAGELSENISVNFKDAIPNYAVFETISKYHVFVLPTLGENFGHAIFEALSAGRPVLISNQTPWYNLASQKIGWDISLDQPKEFTKVIEEISGWSQYDFDNWCNNAYNFAQDFTNKKDLKQQYKILFT